MGDITQAITCYTRAIEIDARSPYDFFWRGCLYYQLNQLQAARKDFEQALEMEDFWPPEREEAERYLAAIADREDQLEADG